MKKLNNWIIRIGKTAGIKAVNSDCDYYLYNEPIPKNLKKYQNLNKDSK